MAVSMSPDLHDLDSEGHASVAEGLTHHAPGTLHDTRTIAMVPIGCYSRSGGGFRARGLAPVEAEGRCPQGGIDEAGLQAA